MKRLGRSLRAGDVEQGELRGLTACFRTAKPLFKADMSTLSYDTVVVDHDLVIRGDFDTAAHKLCRLIVRGSLRVSGLYRDHDDPSTGVFVLGNMEAGRVITNGTLAVAKDLVARDALVGLHNDHSAEIHGNVVTKLFVPENHFFAIGGKLRAEVVLGEDADCQVLPPRLGKTIHPVPDDEVHAVVVREVLDIEEGGDGEPPTAHLDHTKIRERVAKGELVLSEPEYYVHDINGLLRSYRRYPDEGREVETRFVTLFRFLDSNKLLKRRIVDASGRLTTRTLTASEYTAEGFEFERDFVPQWLSSRGLKKDPTSTKLLEKYLSQLRTKRLAHSRKRLRPG
jgi:hypothetical protein